MYPDYRIAKGDITVARSLIKWGVPADTVVVVGEYKIPEPDYDTFCLGAAALSYAYLVTKGHFTAGDNNGNVLVIYAIPRDQVPTALASAWSLTGLRTLLTADDLDDKWTEEANEIYRKTYRK